MNNAIEIHNLNKSYPGFGLKNISFTVPQGLCCGLVGPNGAGKSTILRIMAGMASPDSGEIRLSGKPSGDPSSREEIAILFDQPYFQEDWTPADIEKSLRPFYPSWDGARYRDCLNRFGLSSGKKFKYLSRGMKQKLAMAVHLSHYTRILLLDEPTGGLDPAARDELLDIFREYLLPEDRTILFSTHITGDLERIADKIVYIHNGEISYQGDKDQLISFGFLIHALLSLFMYPMLFKLGYQKGKMWGYYLPAILVCLAYIIVQEYDSYVGGTFIFNLLVYASDHFFAVVCGISGAGAAALALSCLLSIRIYSRREF